MRRVRRDVAGRGRHRGGLGQRPGGRGLARGRVTSHLGRGRATNRRVLARGLALARDPHGPGRGHIPRQGKFSFLLYLVTISGYL